MKTILLCLIFVSPAFAMAPLANDYSDKNEIYREFKNLFDNSQDQVNDVFSSTPNYTDIKDGHMAIYFSSPSVSLNDVRLILRQGTTLYVSPQFTVIKGR